ncbi:MAG TPA: hypothetical protein VIL55_06430 [Naasia sp.]
MTVTASAHPRARHRLLEASALPPAAVLAGGVLLWLALGAARSFADDPLVIAVWATLGAFVVPLTLVLAMARRSASGPGTAALLRTLIYGGIASAAVAGSAGALLIAATGGATLSPTLVLGSAVLEEGTKLALVLLLARRFSPTAGTGLLLGGAVGAGYAAFDALGRILEAHVALNSALLPAAAGAPILLESGVAIQHALLAPLGHPLWSALLAAVALPALSARGGWGRIAVAGIGVVAAHAIFTSGVAAAAGLLGSGPAAVLTQVAVGAALALPALLAWRTVRAGAAQAGGA